MLWCMAGNTVRTTPKSRTLGAELRKARERAGLGLRGVSEMIGTSHATVSRWETGERTPKIEAIGAYLQAVEAPHEIREEILELAKSPNGPQWLSIGMPEQPRQMATLLEIERDAEKITTVSPLLVPGLLQTADYARAIMTTGGVPDDEIETRVAVRLGRRDTIMRRDPAQLVAYIGEPALRQAIGGREVMRDQLGTLLKLGGQDNVTLRVLPIDTGWHAGLEGPFSLVTFKEGRGAVVSAENRVSALYLHQPDDVAAYESALPRMDQVALNAEASVRFISDLM